MTFERVSEFLKKPDFGLLILRAGLGAMMVGHGIVSIFDGNFESLGSKMAILGITSGYQIWGLLAAMTHAVGGFLVVIGYCFRPACFLICLTMLIATGYHLDENHDILFKTGHSIKTAVVFLALCFTGPGRFCMQRDRTG